MKTTDYAGIDYSHGLANVDIKTGVRYGVINLNSCHPEFLAEFEPYYGEEIPEDADYDFAEPISWIYDHDGIKAEYGSDSSTMFVFSSPVIVKTQFCSPCYPGAGNLDSLCEDGVETYGLPADCLDTQA
jgi:hypothetical protein